MSPGGRALATMDRRRWIFENVGSNIALAVMPRSHWSRGTQVKVQLPKDGMVDAEVVRVPFFDPTKERPKSAL